MATMTDDSPTQLQLARAARDRLVAEQDDVRAKLGPADRTADADRTLRLTRREAELPGQVSAAKVLAERCAIAELEAELVESRDDYDGAIRHCAREKAAGGGARPGWERARDRLLRASVRIERLELVLSEHVRELAALLARAYTTGSRGDRKV